MAFEDDAEFRPIKSGKRHQIDESCPVLGPTHRERDGCQVFREHDPEMMVVPLEMGGMLDCLRFETGRGGEELDRKSVDEKSFLVEFPIAQLTESLKNGIERDEQCPRFWFKKHKHIDVPGCKRFTMKSGRCCAADGVAGKHTFTQEPFEDVTDGLHAFLMDSSWRVSRINWPMRATFSWMGRLRCFSRQRGIPRLVEGKDGSDMVGECLTE